MGLFLCTRGHKPDKESKITPCSLPTITGGFSPLQHLAASCRHNNRPSRTSRETNRTRVMQLFAAAPDSRSNLQQLARLRGLDSPSSCSRCSHEEEFQCLSGNCVDDHRPLSPDVSHSPCSEGETAPLTADSAPAASSRPASCKRSGFLYITGRNTHALRGDTHGLTATLFVLADRNPQDADRGGLHAPMAA